MSPLGKSGKYYMNPHDMARKGDAPEGKDAKPGAAKPIGDKTKPADQERSGDDAQGDGSHHHEIVKDDSTGMVHSIHTHPDGRKEEMDHDSYKEARDHQDQMMGEESGEDSEDEEDAERGSRSAGAPDEDLAGMYADED